MAIKIGSTDINKCYLGSTEIKKIYLGSDLILDNSATYFRRLNEVNNDILQIPNYTVMLDTLNTPYYVSLDVDLGASILGNQYYLFNYNGRVRVLITGSGDVRVYRENNTFSVINNFMQLYKDLGRQTIKVVYDSNGVNVLIDNVSIHTDSTTIYNSSAFYFDILSSNGSLNMSADLYSVDLNGQVWGLNEPSGFESYSNLSLLMQGQTSNAGGITYWDNNVIQEE